MPSAFSRATTAFLDLFRSKQPALVVEPLKPLKALPALDPTDFQSKREMFPVIPGTGWDANAVMQMLDAQSNGIFLMPELFYHAIRKEALIAAALDMRQEYALDIPWKLQLPKDAPDEMHLFVDWLAKDWQQVMPDAVRGEIAERVNFFGFQVCRIQWVWHGHQKQPRLIPYTHSSLTWRQDMWCFQGLSEKGLEYIRSDGREWVIFTRGGTRPWLKGLVMALGRVYWQLITGDDQWVVRNDKYANPLKLRYMPRLVRETVEAQRLHERDQNLRGGDLVLNPRDSDGTGYDFKYAEIDGSGYETIAKNLDRFDERAAILILGHNLLQSVSGGSLAAMREAMKLLRIKVNTDCRRIMSGFEPIAKVWARANFGDAEQYLPELNGQPIEDVSWSLVYDLSDPDAKQAAAVSAAQYAQGFATFAKAAGEKLAELPIDWEEAAEKCGIPMLSGEDSYDQDDADEANLSTLDGHLTNKAGIAMLGGRGALVLQTLILLKTHFHSAEAAKKWVSEHGYKTGLDETRTSYRFRQRQPSRFSRMVTVPFGKEDSGIKAVMGRLKD